MVTVRFALADKVFDVEKKEYSLGGTCIQLWCDGEPWATVTKCFPDVPHAEDEVFLDLNNCQAEIERMAQVGLIKITDMGIRSGWCVYPLGKILF